MNRLVVLILLLAFGQVAAYDNRAPGPVFWWFDYGDHKISTSEEVLEEYCRSVSCKDWGEKAKYCQITKPGSARPPEDHPESAYPEKWSRRPCVYKVPSVPYLFVVDYIKAPFCPKGTAFDSKSRGCICNGDKELWVNNQCVVKVEPRQSPDKRPSKKTCAGNPISIADNCKTEKATDVGGALPMARTYYSNSQMTDTDTVRLFGKRWVTRFDARLWDDTERVGQNKPRCFESRLNGQLFCLNQSSPLVATVSPQVVSVSRSHGGRDVFTFRNGIWQSDKDITSQLRSEIDGDGKKQWIYTEADGSGYERFSDDGRLLSIHQFSGSRLDLTYSTGNTNNSAQSRWPDTAPVCQHTASGNVLPAGRLLCVTDQFQRQLNFEYDEKGRVIKLLDPAGKALRYEYDGVSGGCNAATQAGEYANSYCAADNLTKIEFPDGRSRTYHYNESSRIQRGGRCGLESSTGFGWLFNALTGITDENGVRYVSWDYDCAGYAIGSENAGGINKVGVSPNGTRGLTVFHGMNGETPKVSYIYFENILGVARISQTYSYNNDPPCPVCDLTKKYVYDANGNISEKTNYNNQVTQYSYDLTRNLETLRKEAAGSANPRITKTEWHPSLRLPVQISEPLLRTVFVYDDKGNLLSKTQQATKDNTGAQGFAAQLVGTARRWTYTYNALGQVLTVTGPRSDVVDKTTYSYDEQGNMLSITNAQGHVTRLSDYDAYGRVGKVVDANGLSTSFKYHVRGWLSERSVTGGGITETTRYDYDGLGQLLSVTLPDGSSLNYTYDDAHRLTDIRDSLGNHIHYTLDNQSNRITEQVNDASGQMVRKLEKVYDYLYRVTQVNGG